MITQKEINAYRAIADLLEDVKGLKSLIDTVQKIMNNDRRHVIELQEKLADIISRNHLDE